MTSGAQMQVWAPRARRVRLRRVGDDGSTLDEREMTAGAGGWWGIDGELADGERYGFVIDDGDQLRPDPRSRRQPDGVHAASAVFDETAFTWTDRAWTGRQLAGGLIYELHV
ncbi:MAG: malto-oligosyltrehalose trehalohydrolase, partial [Actinomycetota bacterium]|nr:malto-oligosyltrehalose trehalohydrolase [Actinomycetota bacterium]